MSDHFDLTSLGGAGLGKPPAGAAGVRPSALLTSGLFDFPAGELAAFSIPSPAAARGGRGGSTSGIARPRAAGGGAAAAAALAAAEGGGGRAPASASASAGSRTPGGGGGGGFYPRPVPPTLAAVKVALGFEAEEAKAKELDDLASRYGPRAPRTATGGAAAGRAPGGGGAAPGATTAAAAAGGGEGPTLESLLAEMATLVTETDAVAFFLRHGEECPVKHMYLVNAVDTDPRGGWAVAKFAPYSLLVAPEVVARKRPDGHYVMSARGVMYNRAGHPSEFTPLAEFMREKSAFAVISAQSFFKMYLKRKMMNSWVASVRFNRYLRARAGTRARLWAWSPAFAPAMAEIATQLASISSVAAVFVAPAVRFSAASLQESQAAVRGDASKRWEKLIAAVLSSVDRVVLSVGQRVLAVGAPSLVAPAAEKNASMALLREREEARRAELRAAEADEALLGVFVRRVDYMVTATLAAAVEASFATLLREARIDGGARNGGQLFTTAIKFMSDGATGFEPSLGEYLGTLDQLAADTMRTVGALTRVLHARSVRPHVLVLAKAAAGGQAPPPAAAGGEGGAGAAVALRAPSAGEILDQSATFRSMRDALEATLSGDFAAAQTTFATSFDVARPVAEYARSFDWPAFAAAPHTTTEIQKEMVYMKQWNAMVKNLPAVGGVGCLALEGRRVKSELEPVTDLGLERLKGLVLDSCRVRCKAATAQFTERARVLEQRPPLLDKFARYMQQRAHIKEVETPLMRELAGVEELFSLAKAYEVRITPEDSVAYADIGGAASAYTEALASSSGWVEERLPDMCRQLDVCMLKNNDALKVLGDTVGTGVFVDSAQAPADVLAELHATSKALDSLRSQAESYAKWQVLFSMTTEGQKDNPRLTAAVKAVETRTKLWRGLEKWAVLHAAWTQAPWSTVDVEDMGREMQLATKAAFGFDKTLADPVSALFKSKVVAFRNYVGVATDLGNRAIRERHWARLYRECGAEFVPNHAGRTLQELLDMKVYENPDLCAEISGVASGELQLENTLAKIEEAWASTSYATKNYREQRGVYILSALDDIITQLEDHQVTLQTMLGSRFIAGVREGVELWDKRLALLSETQDEWLTCQRQWMYLETIFSAEDIQRQLPVEAQKFALVDRKWKEIMLRTHGRPLVMASLDTGDELLKTFQSSNVTLEAIQKALEEYLETKRSAFPRFYFLSNDELLAILAQTRDPRSVQPHMQKCFDAVKALKFSKTPHPENPEAELDTITHMISPEGEEVKLYTPVPTLGNVEDWLTAFEEEMRVSLRQWSELMWKQYPAPEVAVERKDWYFKGPAQCILGVDIIRWSENCTIAIKKGMDAGSDAVGPLQAFFDFSMQQIDNMVALVRGELSNLDRTLVGSLTVIDVHARDVVSNMIAKKVSSLEDFEWTKQLRYYWENDVIVRQCNTRFASGHEYLGNSERLVITPLTDQCYMTLTGALHLKFGGAPAGPAGTGKTETTKDLAKALCVQCVVFNCSDGLDYKIMGRFFSGLASAGCWACFDEFNRIDIEVLSVIAQQVLTIQQGLMSNAPTIFFEGRDIPLKPTFGVFITMNPGYAGRSDLPDNLKSLFRPVAMMVPDYRLIAEIILFSKGFGDALLLSNKMVNLYKLASEQLSKQDHYDFGMRAVKSVLVAAGQLKRKEPDVREDILLIRAMRDSNVPKFLAHDLPLFRGIISDLFPGVDVPLVDYGKLQQAVELQLYLAGLQKVPSLIEKIIQTHETQLVRHGMMLVGESGSGKTVNHITLSRALKQLYDEKVVDKDGFFKEVVEYVLNPKSISMGELYGEFNLATQEWRDGLVACLVREAVADTSPSRKWVIFDGPVDAIWIENMNTVLDDNKMLCLANGERIKLPPSMHMMFEVRDLAVASPATVSRCGMVFCEPLHVGTQALVDTWRQDLIADLLPAHAVLLHDRITEHLPKIMRFLRRDCTETIASQDGNLVASFLNMLLTLLSPENGVVPPGPRVYPITAAARAKAAHEVSVAGGGALAGDASAASPAAAAAEDEALDGDDGAGGGAKKKGGLGTETLNRMVDLAYVFSVVWAFGANLHDSSRKKFNSFVTGLLAGLLDQHKEALPLPLGSTDTADLDVYGCYFDPAAATLRPWEDQMAKFTYVAGMPFFSILVPSVDTTRYAYLFKTIMGSGRNVLFAGETGVGKSVIIADSMAGMISGEFPTFAAAFVNFSAQTSSGNLQEALEANLEKKRKNLMGAPAGKKMLVFVDDLNMPAKEKYGAQPPIELLRQVIDQGGFYDRAKLFFKNVADTVFASACAPPGGGRQDVTTRLTRRFHMVWLPALSVDSMKTIFQAILGGFLALEVPSLKEHVPAIVAASVEMFQQVGAQMLPTPAKSHYTFNLRDLSKVFQGVLLARKRELPTVDALLRLWLHEEQRVFRDRLTMEDDNAQFNELCRAALKKHLNVEWGVADFAEVLWGDFTNPRGEGERPYLEVNPQKVNLPKLLESAQDDFNLEGKPMNLTFFAYAIAHVSRVCRILKQPRGNALLVGVGGSGRQSLTRLAAFIADMRTISIEISRGYGKTEWHEDLVRIMQIAGAKQKDVVFLFSDTQIVKESMLEDINNILNSGDVPNLYPPDVMEQILNAVRPVAKQNGRPDTRGGIFAEYVQQVREHLHIVLAMSPIGAAFRNRCRMFPALVNCCTIDWFSAWPQDALFGVARSFLADSADSGGGGAATASLQLGELVDPLCGLAVSIHQSVEAASARYLAEMKRYNYTTPTSYLELLRLYSATLTKQRSIVTGKLARYKNGLTKLAETNKMVAGLQAKLTELQPVLEKAKADTAELLVKLEVDQKEADAAAALAAKDEAATAEVAAHVQRIKEDCQKDLDEALPAYYAAMKALKSLDKKSINEVKSFANPPRLVGVVMEAVCILMGMKEDWDSAKALLGKTNFMDLLVNYDKDNIDPKIIKKVTKYIKDPEFTTEIVAKTSVAATSLCAFVRAIYKYHEVALTIAPKKAKLAEAEGKLEEANALLAVKRAGLAAVLARLAELKAQFNASLAKRDELNANSQKTMARLGRAEQLIGGLGSESVRWSAAADQLEKDLANLIGNILLAAGAIAYLGPFTAGFRADLTKSWIEKCTALNIPVDPAFDLVRLLSDPTTVREWNIQGLPTDAFSTENGLFATMGRRWPLMIDPQGQANRWMRNMYKKAKLQLIKQTEPTFLRSLENGVRYGMPVLLENVEEELDPALEPVLLKQYQKKGGQILLRLGDTDVPVSEEFTFLITTKLANPHYLPEVCIKVTIINFTVTMSGLTDQLLGLVVSKERPDLEAKRDKLVLTTAADQRALKEIEDKILQMLADSKGDILDDEDLIASLGQSKVTSTQIGERMKEAAVTGKEISTAREAYRPVAARGATLYFSIASMSMIDNMYQFSLSAFSRLYNLRIEKSAKADALDARIASLLDDITRSFYANVCRGLFEVHKLLYALIMASDMLRVDGEVTPEEWSFFLLSPAMAGRPLPGACTWLSSRQWGCLLALEEACPALAGLAGEVAGDADGGWRAWLAAKNPTSEALPGGGKWGVRPSTNPGGGEPVGGAGPAPGARGISNFQWLLVVRALREEKVVLGVREFVRMQLGAFFTEPPPFDLEGPYADSTFATPLIFILSPGADPVDYLFKLAKAKGKASGLRIISLGQGQGPLAIALMDKARASGDWVCLQNCHLSVSWLPKLEVYLEGLGGEGRTDHPDFRLWLTSSPTPAFPSAVLQNGVKLTQEPPRGIKAQLRQVFLDLPAKEWEGSTKPAEFKRLMFALAFYHAVVLERRKFGPIGWNIAGIDFMASDLKTAAKNLNLYLEEQPVVPWETLNSVVGDINYGGRLTDKWDKRCNRSVLARYLTSPVLGVPGSYCFDIGGVYHPPDTDATLESVRAYIDALPQDESMDVYGLHENAAISLQLKETGELLETIVSIQPRSGGGGGGGKKKSSDEVVLELADDILKRLPPPLDPEAAHADTFAMDGEGVNSLGVFLQQEMTRFNELTKVMRNSLRTLQKAIKGLVVMSSALEAMAAAMLFQRVPPAWEAAAYPSLKPLGGWVADLVARLGALDSWLRGGPPPAFWISGFFFPQGFMTGALQMYARKTKIPIDTLEFKTHVTHMKEGADVAAPPADGVYVYGLFIVCARWDDGAMVLAEMEPGRLLYRMPVVWLEPVLSKNLKLDDGKTYACPFYKTSRRAGVLSTTGHSTNFVMVMGLPSAQPQDHWVRRGTAVLSEDEAGITSK